jgi:hypothetical protein
VLSGISGQSGDAVEQGLAFLAIEGVCAEGFVD